MTQTTDQTALAPRRPRPFLRVLETVLVWLLVLGVFGGLGYGVFHMVKDSPARIVENFARAGANTSTAYSIGEASTERAASRVIEGRTVRSPAWEVIPSPIYPRFDGEMVPGIVALSCVIDTAGHLTNCTIVEEAPTGLGFGDAAIEATKHARLRPRMVDGVAVAGRVQFTTRFSPDDRRR